MAAVRITPVEADQRFALCAENIDPQPWEWRVNTENYAEWGYAAFRWTAVLWSRYWAWRLDRKEALRCRTGKRAETGGESDG